MGSYGTTDEGGLQKFKGFMLVGPPFAVRKEFHQPEGEWAQGQWSSVVVGKIYKILPYSVYSYDGKESFTAPEDCVGHQCTFFVQHPLKNHLVGDGYDDYRYLATRWDKFGRPWPNFTTEMILGKAGASTRGLDVKDDEELMKQIVALLNTGKPFPVAMWDSRQGDIERQIPKGTEVLAQFYRFLYWDWKKGRPTWMSYQAEGDNGEYTVRDVTFLLRVVAPDPWTGTVLRLSVNYTIKHGQNAAGESQWQQHEMANFSDVMKTFGVSAEDFAETVDESLLHEVEIGEPANWLGPLEAALQGIADRRLLHVTIPPSFSIRAKHVKIADALVIEKITGQQAFVPAPLRSISDLSQEQIDAATKEEEEPVPRFEGSPEEYSYQKAMETANAIAGFPVWEAADGRPPTEPGLTFAKMYLVPLFAIVGLTRQAPFAGWTDEKATQMRTLMDDDTFRKACKSSSEAAIAYGQSLLEGAGGKSGGGSAF